MLHDNVVGARYTPCSEHVVPYKCTCGTLQKKTHETKLHCTPALEDELGLNLASCAVPMNGREFGQVALLIQVGDLKLQYLATKRHSLAISNTTCVDIVI